MKRRITHIAEIGLRVNDLPKMVYFYQEELGFEVEIAGSHHVFLKVGELDSPLGQIGHPQMLVLFDRQAPIDIQFSSLDHLAFEIPNEFYREEFKRFDSRGMVLRERSWPDTLDWRGRSFFINDPEGNVVVMIASNSSE